MDRLDKEVDIVEMVKSRRYLHLALKQLLDKPTRKELKENSKIELVSIKKAETSDSKKKSLHLKQLADKSAKGQERSLQRNW